MAPGVRRCGGLFALCTAIGLLLTGCRAEPSAQLQQPVTLTISAASDLTYAFPEIAKLFEEETGHRVLFNFGSTGQLALQIEQGAPVDLFAAADAGFIDELERQGLILPESKQLYGRGRITIWTRADSSLQLQRLEDLARPDITRVAIANPDHAPYGMAARQALQAAGVWEAVQPKLVFGENVRQALQYAESGNADVAILALALSGPAGGATAGGSPGRFTLIPQELHQPMDQVMSVIKGTPNEDAARAFASFVNGPKGRPIMRQFGFVLPGEEPLP